MLQVHRSVHNLENREGIDARNSECRPKTFAEICANKHNDPSFKPKSNAYPDLHDDFISCYDLFENIDNAEPIATPGKKIDKLSEVQSKVCVAFIIFNATLTLLFLCSIKGFICHMQVRAKRNWLWSACRHQ